MRCNPSIDPNAELRARLLHLTDGELVASLLEEHDRVRRLARRGDSVDDALTTEAIVIRTVLDRLAPEALVLGDAIREGTLDRADDHVPIHWAD